MNKFLVLLLVGLCPFSLHAETSVRVADHTREVVLKNGMHVLLVQRPGAPMVAAGWVAHVGSANEHPGITGISHLFEHMMFKGSDRIGTRDADLDRMIRSQLDQVREKMFVLEREQRARIRRAEADSMEPAPGQEDELKKLKQEFADLIKKQRSNMIKDEFDQIYTREGGTRMNAFTNEDMTVYFINVPANKLELWFWMESERLSKPVFREFYSERDVVFEERRMRTDSTPTGAVGEVFSSLFWRGHPYGWPVVGWPSDISSITRQQAEDYFGLYYAPNNITAAIVGDFDEDQAIKMANQYFGRIPRGPKEPPDVVTLYMPQKGEVVYRSDVEAPPQVQVMFHTMAVGGKDEAALSLMAEVLNGKTGRLYKRLVLKDQIATSASAQQDSKKYDGSFVLSAQGKKGVTPEQLRDVLFEEIQKIQNNGVSDYELEKIKNQVSASSYRRLVSPFGEMIQLLIYDGLKNWKYMDQSIESLMKVTKQDIQRVANNYLVDDSRAVMLLNRKKGEAQ